MNFKVSGRASIVECREEDGSTYLQIASPKTDCFGEKREYPVKDAHCLWSDINPRSRKIPGILLSVTADCFGMGGGERFFCRFAGSGAMENLLIMVVFGMPRSPAIVLTRGRNHASILLRKKELCS